MGPRTVEAEVKRRALVAAKKRSHTENPIGWADALAEAPWPSDLPAAWERAFRTLYAQKLVQRGLARPTQTRPTGGTSGPPGETELIQCKLYLLPKEYAEQRAKAKAVDLKWSTWARRKLSQ